MNNKKTIYLIDGSAYIYRGFHALPPLTNSKGIPTNAVLGFTNILSRLIKEKKPEYAIMFFDAKGPTFRHEIYSEYKANRPPMPEELSVQIPYIKQVSKGYRLLTIEKQGYEADDLIGTAAKKAAANGYKVVIVTADKDFMQLIDENILMFDPMKNIEIDSEAVKEKTGVYPDRITDIMALTGDASDNVPGVPGIGKKTAPVLIQKYESLDGLYKNIDDITAKKQKENLVNYKEQAYLSKTLVTIETNAEIDIDLDESRYQAPDDACLFELFSELEFRKYQQMHQGGQPVAEKKYHLTADKKALDNLVDILNASEVFAVDTETTSVNPMQAELVGMSFSVKADEAYYVPCAHKTDTNQIAISYEEAINALRPVLENADIKKVGQNIKYDMIVLKRHGIELSGVTFDTMVASYLVNPAKRAHSLDQLAMEILNHKTTSYDEVAGKGKNALCFSEVPLEKAVPYACEDADITFALYLILKKQLEDANLISLLDEVELPLLKCLVNVEMNGISVNEQKLSKLSQTFSDELDTIEQEIYDLAGEEFNIKSSQQLGHILFEKLELPAQKKTKKKTGYSTDADVLASLAPLHKLPALVVRFRTLAKLKSTYTDALLKLVHPETGRIHTSFNQTVAVTGRLSSSSPNLQNIPVKTEEGRMIREAFIPPEKHVLLSADYSQIELRLLAHYSDDPILIESFTNDEDIHTRTAAEVFDYHPSLVTAEVRNQAKAINFGIIYGMSPFGLSKELGISQKMAKTFITNYFNRYSGVKDFIDKTIEEAKKTAVTSTLLGRTRNLPEINSSNRNVQQFAERVAVNTPVQGTAADLIKLAMIQTEKALAEKNIKAKMLLSVHDEIVFEVPDGDADSAAAIIKEVMEHIWELKVPLKVNINSGGNWSEAH